MVNINTIYKITALFRKLFQPFSKEPPSDIPYSELVICANLSELSYRNPDKVEQFANAGFDDKSLEQFKNIKPVFYDGKTNKKDTQGYLWTIGEKAYLVFRGTESTADKITDIDIRRHGWFGKVKVHNGFYHQFEAVKDAITNDLKIHPEVKELIVTGHSLGGALATIAAAHFAAENKELVVKCYTYGAPRVGNKTFIEWFHANVKQHYRVTNCHDPVPLVPLFRFYHTHNQLLLEEDKKVKFIKKDFMKLVRPCVSIGHIDFLQPISDHNCALYINRLEALASPKQ
jgi:hypothetical protein